MGEGVGGKGENAGGKDTSNGAKQSVTKQKKQYVRTKHECPFPLCKSVVLHPRRMRLSHNWNKEDAFNVVNTFGLRKARSKSAKSKQQLKSFTCPVPGCLSVVKRIHNHLTDVHNAIPGTAKYKYALSLAKVHKVIATDISSESSMTDDSDSSYDDEEWKKQIGQKWKKSLLKQIYPSDEEETSCSGDLKQKKQCTRSKRT